MDHLYIIIDIIVVLILYALIRKSSNKKIKIDRKNFFILSNLECLKNLDFVIDHDNFDQIMKFLEKIDTTKDLELMIITEGGIAEGPDLITYYISQIKEKFNFKVKIYVPYYAQSCGSMMILCGDEIYMNWYSVTSPIDTQSTLIDGEASDDEEEAAWSVKYIKELDPDAEYNKNIMKLQIKESQSLYKEEMFRLNKILKSNSNKNKIIKKIFNTKFSHDFNFYYEDLQDMGLNVITPIPEDVSKIFDKFKNLIKS